MEVQHRFWERQRRCMSIRSTLKCRSDIQFRDKNGNLIDLSGYAVSTQGVAAKGELHPWADPQAAAVILKKLQNPTTNSVARQEAKNQAVVDKMGGDENFRQFFMANMCHWPLIAIGAVQGTPKELSDIEDAKKKGMKLDTSSANIENCKAATKKFCARTDLPNSMTQKPEYKGVCADSMK